MSTTDDFDNEEMRRLLNELDDLDFDSLGDDSDSEAGNDLIKPFSPNGDHLTQPLADGHIPLRVTITTANTPDVIARIEYNVRKLMHQIEILRRANPAELNFATDPAIFKVVLEMSSLPPDLYDDGV